LTLPFVFNGVRGTFIQDGNSEADDCYRTSAADSWDEVTNGHGGISIFGTPDQILYPGCGWGRNVGRVTRAIEATDVPSTSRLRFQSHQSVDTEVVVFQLTGIQVRLATTNAPTTGPTGAPSPAPTFHADFVTLQNAVTGLQLAQSTSVAQLSTTMSMAAAATAATTAQTERLDSQQSTIEVLEAKISAITSAAAAVGPPPLSRRRPFPWLPK
jgi:hypothetical protein